MSLEPTVSVVLATNRAGPFLAEALDSAARQTHPAAEIIVVDDGAEDPAAVDSAVSGIPNARVLHRPAAGVSAARNAGVAEAQGELLVFLDDDDRWSPRRLEIQAAALAADVQAVAAYCGMRTIDEQGRVLVEADQVPVADRLGVARRETGILLPNLVVRRSALLSVGGFHSVLRMAEDLDLILRLAEQGAFLCTPEALVDYRAHGANTTRRHRELTAGVDQVLQLHRGLARARGDQQLAAALTESLRKNRRFAWWGAARAAQQAWSAGAPVRAVQELGWALATAPTGALDGGLRQLRRRLPHAESPQPSR